jgi:hypothetical protein
MLKPPIEIVCLSVALCVALCGVAWLFYLRIRSVATESGLFSRDFFRCTVQGKNLWIVLSGIIAALFLIDALFSH